MPDRYSQRTPEADLLRQAISVHLSEQAAHDSRQQTLDERRAELAYLAKTTRGVSVTETARALGLTRKRLYEEAAQHAMQRRDSRIDP